MGEETRTDNKYEENKTADRLEVREENVEITTTHEAKTAA